MIKRIGLALAILLVLSSLFILSSCDGKNEETQEKYVLYVGFSESSDDDKIKNEIHGICMKYVEGYTLVEGSGGFTSNGKFVAEETLIYTFCFVEKQKIVDLANDILKNVEGTNILFETQPSDAVHSTSESFPK